MFPAHPHRSRWASVLVLAAFAASLAGCGRPGPTRQDPHRLDREALRTLLPDRPVAQVSLTALDSVQALVEAALQAVPEASRPAVDLETWQASLGAPFDAVDPSRPVALGAIAGMPFPVPTLVVPVRDTTGIAETVRQRLPNTRVAVGPGNYVAVSLQGGGPAPGGEETGRESAKDSGVPPLARGAAADVRVVLRMDALLQAYAPYVAMGLGALQERLTEGLGNEELAREATAAVRRFVQSLGDFQLDVGRDAEQVRVGFRLESDLERPRPEPTVKSLHAHLRLLGDEPWPLVALQYDDLGMGAWNRSQAEAALQELPPEARAMLHGAMENLTGPYWQAVRWVEGTPEFLSALAPPDGESTLQVLGELVHLVDGISVMGVHARALPAQRMGTSLVQRLAVDVDLDMLAEMLADDGDDPDTAAAHTRILRALLGRGAWTVGWTLREGIVLLAGHADPGGLEAVFSQRVSASAKPPAWLDLPATQELLGWMRLDPVPLVRAFLPERPAPRGAPPITYSLLHTPAAFTGDLRVAPATLRWVVEAVQEVD